MREVQTMDGVMKREKANGVGSSLVCGGRTIHYDFSLGKFRVEECANCGLMRLNPQPTDEGLADICDPRYFAFSNDPEGQLHASELRSNQSAQLGTYFVFLQ